MGSSGGTEWKRFGPPHLTLLSFRCPMRSADFSESLKYEERLISDLIYSKIDFYTLPCEIFYLPLVSSQLEQVTFATRSGAKMRHSWGPIRAEKRDWGEKKLI